MVGFSNNSSASTQLNSWRRDKRTNLPVQYSPESLMIINIKIAKALGLTIPPGVLAAAEERLSSKSSDFRNWHKPAVGGRPEHFRSARVLQTSTCSAIARASSPTMPRPCLRFRCAERLVCRQADVAPDDLAIGRACRLWRPPPPSSYPPPPRPRSSARSSWRT
jgi:hypothetical protein